MTSSATSTAFREPPKDGSLTPPKLLDWHTAHNPSWVAARYKQSGTTRNITWQELSRSIHSVARYLAPHFRDIDVDRGLYPSTRTTVAIIANVEPLQFFIAFWALMRLGLVPFALSTNNSKDALLHLIKTSGTTAVLRGPLGTSPALDAVIDSTFEDEAMTDIQSIAWPKHEQIYDIAAADFLPITTYPDIEPTDRMLGVHSSGSTSFPKPIFATASNLTWMIKMVDHGDFKTTGWGILFSSLPPFHAFSLYWGALATLGSGTTILVREPVTPPAPITPASILQDVADLRPDIFLSVPSLYKGWSKSQEAISDLQKVRICVSASGPLDAEAADVLKHHNVPLVNLLASSEVGVVSAFPTLPDNPFALRFNTIPRMILRPTDEADVYEMVVAANPQYHYTPLVTNEVINGEAVYATSDLIKLLPRQRPTDEQSFIVVGRIDDQIMHSSGEKTNPGPLVAIVQRHAAIQLCCYFGRGKAHPGLLIDPTAEEAIDPADEAALARYRNLIWPAVQEANKFAPSHSRIFKEMIVIASPSKPMPKTPKGTLRTGVAIKMYTDEIEETYRRFEETSASSVALPSEWTSSTARKYVRQVVADVLSDTQWADDGADDERDVFSWAGANSLSSTKIRSVLSASLSQSQRSRLDPNFVYANPTVSALADALLAAHQGHVDSGNEVAQRRVRACRAMYEKYSDDLKARTTASNGTRIDRTAQQSVVLITGTTGGMGAHLLDELLLDESVGNVYAVNRASRSKTLEERQREAFVARGIAIEHLDDAKVHLIEADLTQAHFGLSETVYKTLASQVTQIIHNAWQLDFNLSLASFEPHIKGSRALVDFALASAHRPSIVFTSSIATTGNYKGEEKTVPEEHFESFEVSIGNGYSESKAVVEHLLYTVSELTGLETKTVRIGQMSGSTTNGAWATTDWFPLIVKSGDVLHCLPLQERSDLVAWIPTDVAARVLLDIANAKGTQPGQTFHLIHPNGFSWSSLVKAIAADLSGNVELVPYKQWLRRLQAANAKSVTHDTLPTLKLLSFFEHASTATASSNVKTEAMGIKVLNTAHSQSVSRVLRGAARLDEDSAHEWVRYWKSVGFLA